MSFISDVIKNSQSIWDDCCNHPFIQELKTGVLPISKFENYIVQDSLYLREYARVFAMAMWKSKTLKEMQIFYSILYFVQENESDVRSKYLKQFGLSDEKIQDVQLLPENQVYTQFMLDIAIKEGIPEILMAILPCMLSYLYIAQSMIASNPNIKDTRYYDLIQDYSSQSYQESCKYWEIIANQWCENLSEEHKLRLMEIFKQSSICELDFWKMSYANVE